MDTIAVVVIVHAPKMAHFNEVSAGAEVSSAEVVGFGAASAAIICSADILAINIEFELFVSLVAGAIVSERDIDSIPSAVRQSEACFSGMGRTCTPPSPSGYVFAQVNTEFILGEDSHFEKPQCSCS